MLAEPSLLRLLGRAPGIMGMSTAEDIVAGMCREAAEITGAPFVIAAYAPPPNPWERGLHVLFGSEPRPLDPPERSALFAIHRRLVTQREPIVLERSDQLAGIFDGITHGHPDLARDVGVIHALPIFHRTGRLIGELVIGAQRVDEWGEAVVALPQLVSLTSVALENAQRLAMARRDQDRLLLLAETTDETLWDWNVDSGELWWGGGIHKLLGSGAEPIQTRIEWKNERIHPEDIGRVQATLEQCFASMNSSWNEKYRFRRADGSWAHVEDRGYLLREPDGRAYRLIGALRDVTALYETNQALHENEKRLRAALAQSDIAHRAKDEFLAVVSHELRTPLNAIMGWSKMLNSQTFDEKRRQAGLETIERNAVAMAQLIEDLLDMSRVITGKLRLEVQLVDVVQVIEAAIESIKPAAESKGVEIMPGLDESIPNLLGDPTRLQQIVWNLLSNAVKFTSNGGRVSVRLHQTEASVVLEVCDTGKGIAPAFLPHAFDAFRQEDASPSRTRGGLGLGLAITRQLVELHGGQIAAESEGEGRGATFTVTLPISAKARDASERSPRRIRSSGEFERPEHLRGLRVLVVDDDDDARRLVSMILDDCGCRVTTAKSVDDGMTILSEGKMDVLVSDIAMPEQDGFDFIRRVRALPRERGGDIPAAALTAFARAEDRHRLLNAGYSIHLPKPVEPAELVAVVSTLSRFMTPGLAVS